jgi:phosphatidylglycerophosphate synthase
MAPPMAQFRAMVQPPGLLERNSGEHWAGRLYIRRVSPYVTRALARTPMTPNGVTWLMLAVGVAAAGVLTLPGFWPALAAFALIQAQILLDCCDGELARWRGRTGSPVGIYLDRVAHWVTEAALPIALGIRADGGWGELGGYTTLGMLAAVLSLLIKGSSALVTLARAETGRPVAADSTAVAAPRAGALRRARRALDVAPFFRLFVAMEFTLLVLGAEILGLTRELVVAVVALGTLTLLGRLAAVLASDRLR